MTNYLLTIIGNIESEKMCKEIALSISPLVDSPNLKFQHKEGVLLMHFATKVQKGEIYDYINGVLHGVIDTFILTEINDEVSVSMPKEMFGHLFDLENICDDVTMRIEMSKIIKNQMDEYDNNYELDNEQGFSFGFTLKELKNMVSLMEEHNPTLDQLLDKINNKGYSSLTAFEIDTLQNYSKI
jgi:hypothetical protein